MSKSAIIKNFQVKRNALLGLELASSSSKSCNQAIWTRDAHYGYNGDSEVIGVGGKKYKKKSENIKLPILPEKNASKCIGNPPIFILLRDQTCTAQDTLQSTEKQQRAVTHDLHSCLLYTSDAADE